MHEIIIMTASTATAGIVSARHACSGSAHSPVTFIGTNQHSAAQTAESTVQHGRNFFRSADSDNKIINIPINVIKIPL